MPKDLKPDDVVTPITKPGATPEAKPGAPNSSQQSNGLFYAKIEKSDIDGLKKLFKGDVDHLRDLSSNFEKSCPPAQPAEKPKEEGLLSRVAGFFKDIITKDYTASYNNDRKTIIDDFNKDLQNAEEALAEIEKLPPYDENKQNNEKQHLAERYNSLSLLFEYRYQMAILKNKQLETRYKIYLSKNSQTLVVKNFSEQTEKTEQAEKQIKIDVEQFNEMIKSFEETLKKLKETYSKKEKEANQTNETCQKILKLGTGDKNFAKKLEEYDKKLKSYRGERENFKKDLKSILSQNPSDETSTTPKAMESAPRQQQESEEKPINESVNRFWEHHLSKVYNEITEMIEKSKRFLETHDKLTENQKRIFSGFIEESEKLAKKLSDYKDNPKIGGSSGFTIDDAIQAIVNAAKNKKYTQLIESPKYKKVRMIEALLGSNTEALRDMLTNIKKDPKNASKYLNENNFDELLNSLTSPLLDGLKKFLIQNLNKMKKGAEFIQDGDSDHIAAYSLFPLSSGANFADNIFDSITTPLEEAMKAMNEESEKLKQGQRRLHEEKYKKEKNKDEAYKEEKQYRLSAINKWIDKFEEKLKSYYVDSGQNNKVFIPSASASNPAEAAKDELCNALFDAKISNLQGLDPRNPYQIRSAWQSLTSISAIEQYLKTNFVIEGRTESMIYNLYAVLHILSKGDNSTNSSMRQKELNKLSKKLNGASGLAMRMAKATIYKAKSKFQSLIKFLIEFLSYPIYDNPKVKDSLMNKNIKEARKEAVESLGKS